MTIPSKREIARRLRLKLRVRQGGKCCYCQRPMTPYPNGITGRRYPDDVETLEHLRRRSEGGKTEPCNVALACFRCNHERGAMDWFTYATYRAGELFE